MAALADGVVAVAAVAAAAAAHLSAPCLARLLGLPSLSQCSCSLARARWLVLVAVCFSVSLSPVGPSSSKARQTACKQMAVSTAARLNEAARCVVLMQARAEQAAHAHHCHHRPAISLSQLVGLELEGRTRCHPCVTHSSTAISARAGHTHTGRARRVPELVGVGDYPIARPMSLNARLARIGTTPSSARRRSGGRP